MKPAFLSLSLSRAVALLALAQGALTAACAGQPPPPRLTGEAVAAPPKASPASTPTSAGPSAAPPRFTVDVDYHTLDNGLKVVLSRNPTVPTVAVTVYYDIGFRIEPKDRTGFAHLFEHLMFQGSKNLGKNEFSHLVRSNGGIDNGSTRFDFTNYMEIVPAHIVEPVLWAEADRMRGLAITQENLTNQQNVVKNEVKGNVLNAPYGGFPWLDVPQYANQNWYNAHNFYGDLSDIDAATLADAQKFFDTYYAPSNAVLVVSGDIDKAQTLGWVKKYFGDLRKAPKPPKIDITEPRQEKEKRASRPDPLATRPALAVAYHTPAPGTPEYYAMGLLDQILVQGDDSRLYQAIVQRRGLAGEVSGGINVGLGSMFNIKGPALWVANLIHDADKPAESILAAIDEEVDRLLRAPVDEATLALAKIKMRSAFSDRMENDYGFERADLLACFALFDDDPAKINRIEDEFQKVTPELLLATAKEYLRPTNRTVLTVVPKPAPKLEEPKPASTSKSKR